MEGTLYVCPTPIGNIKDVSERVLETLRAADLVAAEDTRNTGQLLSRYQIKAELISYHQHNEKERTEQLVPKAQRRNADCAGYRRGHACHFGSRPNSGAPLPMKRALRLRRCPAPARLLRRWL